MIMNTLRYCISLYSFLVIIPGLVLGRTLVAVNDTSASTPFHVSIGFMIGGNGSVEKNGDVTPGYNYQSHISVVVDSWSLGIGYRVLPGEYKEQTMSPSFKKVYQHDMNILMLSGGRAFKKNEFTFYTTLQLLYVNTSVATAETRGGGNSWDWLSIPIGGSWNVLSDIRQSCFGAGVSAEAQSKISKNINVGLSLSFHTSKLVSAVFMGLTLSLDLSAR